MRLLVLSALRKTLHETTLGVDLVTQLEVAGVQSHFVIDAFNEDQLKAAGFPYTLVDPSMGAAVRTVVEDVAREFRPDAVVLADYLGHWMTFEVTYGCDPWFIDELGLPLIPMDLYDLANTSRKVEILGKSTRVSDRILDLPAHLQPVPMNRPVVAGDGPGLPYRATTAVEPLTTEHRATVRCSLGLRDGDRLLMVPTLPWQQLMARHAGGPAKVLAARLPALVAHYLAQLPTETHFLFTGPVFEDVEGLPSDRVHLVPSYTATGYDELLGATDAIMSFHVPSFAIERAVFADVPGMVCLNGFDVTGREDVAKLDAEFGGLTPTVAAWLQASPVPVPAFHMWPLSWNAVLSPGLADNPFTDGLSRAEIFDERSVLDGLGRLLYDTRTVNELAEARARYRDLIDGLPPAPEVFTSAARRLGL
jgi:hypothetical protein